MFEAVSLKTGLTVMTNVIDDDRYHALGKTRSAANKRVEAAAQKLTTVQADMMQRKVDAAPKKGAPAPTVAIRPRTM